MRKQLYKISAAALVALAMIAGMGATSCCGKSETGKVIELPVPARPDGATDVLGLTCDPIPVVRVGFVGLGMRGSGAIDRYLNLEGVEIKALCDLEQYNLDRAQAQLAAKEWPKAEEYIGEEGWKQLCERDDLDLVYICTHWGMHTPIAVYAMEHGKHVAIEVPAATTVAECWDLVNTAEKTRKHCMMLENCCYDFFEMATLSLAQQGFFGEIVHVEGAYNHDLRSLNFAPRLNDKFAYKPGVGRVAADEEGAIPSLTGYWDHWRLKYNTDHTGNPYATHGLGPIAQVLNIHRGDKMDVLVSMSSNQFGMTEYAVENIEDLEPGADTVAYKMGDMNTSLIRTAKGKTIMLEHNVTNPRPYSRLHVISGTKGFCQKYPSQELALEPSELTKQDTALFKRISGHRAMSPEQRDAVLEKYQNPIVKEIGEKAKEVGGHGGMDFIMDYRLIYCLHNGLPLDMDVYDAAEWSCIGELSEISTLNNSAPIAVPDFTRGAWDKINGFKHAMK